MIQITGNTVPDYGYSYLENRTWNTTESSHDETSVSFGDANSDRRIIIALGGYSDTSSFPISSVTIGGVSATKLSTEASADGTNEWYSIWGASVPTGSSGTINVTQGSSTTFQYTFSAYRLIVPGLTPDATDVSSNNSGGVTSCSCTAAAADSIVIWSGGNANQSQGSPTFTNITGSEDNEVDVRSSEWCNQISGTSNGSGTCTIEHSESEGATMALWDV